MAKKSKKKKTTRPAGAQTSRNSAEQDKIEDDDDEELDEGTPTPNPKMYAPPPPPPMNSDSAEFYPSPPNFLPISLFCCCGRRRSNGPCLCCGKRLSRRLRQPGFALSMASTSLFFGVLFGMIFGSLISIALIYHLRISPEDMTPLHATLSDFTVEVATQVFDLVQGGSRQCYHGLNGNKPFAEHDGFYEDLSRVSVM